MARTEDDSSITWYDTDNDPVGTYGSMILLGVLKGIASMMILGAIAILFGVSIGSAVGFIGTMSACIVVGSLMWALVGVPMQLAITRTDVPLALGLGNEALWIDRSFASPRRKVQKVPLGDVHTIAIDRAISDAKSWKALFAILGNGFNNEVQAAVTIGYRDRKAKILDRRVPVPRTLVDHDGLVGDLALLANVRLLVGGEQVSLPEFRDVLRTLRAGTHPVGSNETENQNSSIENWLKRVLHASSLMTPYQGGLANPFRPHEVGILMMFTVATMIIIAVIFAVALYYRS